MPKLPLNYKYTFINPDKISVNSIFTIEGICDKEGIKKWKCELEAIAKESFSFYYELSPKSGHYLYHEVYLCNRELRRRRSNQKKRKRQEDQSSEADGSVRVEPTE